MKGFHRGLELFGQHELMQSAAETGLGELGVLVVEGPNDVIRMNALNEPAVGLCSNTVSKQQAAKIATIAKQYGGNLVTLLLDNDVEGENGAKQAIWELAKQGTRVQLAWWRIYDEGKLANRQPESLTPEEWQEIKSSLMEGLFSRAWQQAETD